MVKRGLAVAGLALVMALPSACTSTEGQAPARAAASQSPSAAPTTPAPTINPRAPQPTPGKIMLGTYLDLKGKNQAASLALRRRQLGRDPRIIHWFYQWDDNMPTSFTNVPRGATVMLSWDGFNYAKINNGSQDKLITQAAKNLAKYGKPIFLRWAWEMNGSWYTWGGAHNGNNPAAFIQAWQHLHDIFVKQGATNVAWVWGPNWQSVPVDPWNALQNYYPGDEYVDWVGVTGYTEATTLTPEGMWDDIYARYAKSKPIMIAETGIREKGGRQSADWLELFTQWLDAHPLVSAVVWFDTDTHRGNDGSYTNFRVDRDSVLLGAYRKFATSPRLGG